MITTNYKIENISNFDEFLYELFEGLKHYKKKNNDFTFKLTFTENNIELKTIKLNESAN